MKRWIPILMTALSLTFSAAAMACPFCKDSVAGPTGGSGLGGGGGSSSGSWYNLSIFVMLGGLFSVLGFVLWTIVKGVRSSVANMPVRPPTQSSQAKTSPA